MGFPFQRRLHILLIGRGRWVGVWDWRLNSDPAQDKQPTHTQGVRGDEAGQRLKESRGQADVSTARAKVKVDGGTKQRMGLPSMGWREPSSRVVPAPYVLLEDQISEGVLGLSTLKFCSQH